MVAQLVRNNSTIWGQAKRARSIKGAPLPEKLINKLVALQKEYPSRSFVIGTARSFSRKKSFFKQNCSSLTFYNKDGEEFEFLETAKEIRFNEMFMAIDFGNDNTMEAFVYTYFPFDGAFR